MSQKKYLFISRKSSHYRYYEKLVKYLGKKAELRAVKTYVFPRLKYWREAKKLGVKSLADVHIKRKAVRHPLLSYFPGLLWLMRQLIVLREHCRVTYYLSFFRDTNYETLVLWNGMKQPNKTPYEVAKYCGLKTMLFENGLLPNTTVLDPKGVNAFNSMPREADFYKSINIDSLSMEKKLEVRAAHKDRKIQKQTVELPERYIFVPFQVPNDTQIVCHSHWVASMEEFYDKLELALNYLVRQSQWRPFKFVVKEHPSWPRTFKTLHNKNKNIVFANEHNTQALIENAIAVMTINSTVGVEGLLLGKKVITLGDSFINVPGIVWQVNNQTLLNQVLSRIESEELDPYLVNRFLTFLKDDYLIPGAWQKVTKDSVSHFMAVENRLELSYQP